MENKEENAEAKWTDRWEADPTKDYWKEYWDNLDQETKDHHQGFMYFSRVHEEDWVQYNAFYSADEKYDNEEDSSNV